MKDKLDPKLKAKIIRESEDLCKICGRNVYVGRGAPHHVIKLSEEPLLRNCKTNIWWVHQRNCHIRTECEPGFNRKLQKQLQDYYYGKFQLDIYYTLDEIKSMVDMPLKDLVIAQNKGFLKVVNNRVEGLDAIRFLLGGKLIE